MCNNMARKNTMDRVVDNANIGSMGAELRDKLYTCTIL